MYESGMAQPRYPNDGTISVLDELRRRAAVEPNDAADTVAKLTDIALHGMGQIGLFSTDIFAPPDLFCRQKNGWLCFYVAKPLPPGDADVVALLCVRFVPGTMARLEQEVANRRALFGV